ncbi:MAG: nitroreductase family protein [Chlorobia bacterium]|nr:nitroreductase family protein [Fimbriimonadaceae bacterium]
MNLQWAMFDESPAEAWTLRYGTEAPELPDLSKFLNHRSVRKFKPDPIPEPMIQGLVAAAQSAATSSNLQLWSIVSVQDPVRREEIAKFCADQSQVRNCAVYFCFIADHYRLRQVAEKQGEACAGLGHTEFFTMAVIDAALAAERMVCAAGAMGLGICYIGALRNDAEGVKNLLNLPEGTFGLFGLCLGWPAEPIRAQIKPRLSQEAIWFRETYDQSVSTEEYDQRMAAFSLSQQMPTDQPWSKKSGKRVDLNHMTGRETLLDWLQGQGFLQH